MSSRLSYAVLAVDGPGLLVDFALASIGRSLDEVEYTLENRRANARQVAEWMAPVEPHLDAIDRGRLKSHFQELLDGASRNCPVENVFQVAMNCSGIAPALRERMNREGVGPESRLAMKMRHQWNEAMELVGRLTHVLGFEEWDPLENLVQPQGQDFMAMADAGRHLLSLEHPDFEPVPAPREILRRAMEASGIDGDRVAALLLSLD